MLCLHKVQVAQAICSSDEDPVLLDNVLPMHINRLLNTAISTFIIEDK